MREKCGQSASTAFSCFAMKVNQKHRLKFRKVTMLPNATCLLVYWKWLSMFYSRGKLNKLADLHIFATLTVFCYVSAKVAPTCAKHCCNDLSLSVAINGNCFSLGAASFRIIISCNAVHLGIAAIAGVHNLILKYLNKKSASQEQKLKAHIWG